MTDKKERSCGKSCSSEAKQESRTFKSFREYLREIFPNYSQEYLRRTQAEIDSEERATGKGLRPHYSRLLG